MSRSLKLAIVCLALYGGQAVKIQQHVEYQPPPVHYVYTAGCNDYQMTQTAALDSSWKEVGHIGKLTRIVIGCENDVDKENASRSPLVNDPDFHIFYASGEDLMKIPNTGEEYTARARPYAISQFLQNNGAKFGLVGILDPDFIFVKSLSDHPHMREVRQGKMMAQVYGLGWAWLFNYETEFKEKQPSINMMDAAKLYSTGPPWIVEKSDLEAMIPDWERYTDNLHKEGDGLLREQTAFIMAAGKHMIPSTGATDLMVSNAMAFDEGWDGDNPELWQPSILHYCQTYRYKEWNFHKALITTGWYGEHFDNSIPGPMQCGAPLMQEPPPVPTKMEEPDVVQLRNAWMISKIIPKLNSAFAKYRQAYCPNEMNRVVHFRRSRTVHPTRNCDWRHISRYMPGDESDVSWDSSAAPEGDVCAHKAQEWKWGEQ